MKVYSLLIFTFLLLFGGCQSISDKQVQQDTKSQLSGTINIVSSRPFYSLANQWAEVFMQNHPNVTIEITSVDPDRVMNTIESKNAQLAMTCMNSLQAKTLQEMWHVTVMKDGIIPITSASNPYIEQLLKSGIGKEILVSMVKQKEKITWGEILKNGSKEPVISFRFNEINLSDDPKETTMLETGNFTEEQLNQVLDKVAAEPYSLSFCSANHAYHCKRENKRTDLEIIPVDLDENDKIDEKEKFYLQLEDLQRAQYLGIYPDELCREMAIISKDKPTNQNSIAFIDYILHGGQKIAVDNGFARISHSKADNVVEELASNQ